MVRNKLTADQVESLFDELDRVGIASYVEVFHKPGGLIVAEYIRGEDESVVSRVNITTTGIVTKA